MPTIGVKRDLLFKALGQEYSKFITPFVISVVKCYNDVTCIQTFSFVNLLSSVIMFGIFQICDEKWVG
jgi:hypothetical protein